MGRDIIPKASQIDEIESLALLDVEKQLCINHTKRSYNKKTYDSHLSRVDGFNIFENIVIEVQFQYYRLVLDTLNNTKVDFVKEELVTLEIYDSHIESSFNKYRV
ncbi:hypothetical protein [Candidatus Nitrosocosmicus franklandus]|uniref:Uncharacterized protein n=1 Tax=Candidatus Nitrosocosmicus franklandianus TaxID=1798806 RepID=A0A484I872_9ARCH|nr:hypothetical protein [Candidatus Nitrosocosmicus franklandus]VFJ13002.1 protein of unknown function [Candidatus Nitrosocosmicus franklandus]